MPYIYRMAYAEIVCTICNDRFKQEKRFIDHMQKAHDLIADETCYLNVNNIDHRKCKCGCGANVQWKGWKEGYTSDYVRGHNALEHNVFKEKAAELAQKRAAGYASGKYKVWNSGLTSETSDKLKSIQEKTSQTLRIKYESGELKPWQYDGDRSESFKKISETKKKLFSEGKIKTWNSGLTKNCDQRLLNVSEKVKQSYLIKGRLAGRRLRPEEFESRFSAAFEMFDPQFNWDDFYRVKLDRFQLKCKTCGKIVEKTLYMLETCPICHFCNPVASKPQIEVFNYVSSLDSSSTLSDRSKVKGYELDVYVPGKNVAFELNGLYWHSEDLRGKNYHVEKTKACHDAGVRLIHIFSDEWQTKKPIIESIIKHSLGLSFDRLNARTCEVRVLTSSERKIFFDSNHLDGDVKSKISWGLIHDGEIVSAISLRKPVHAKYERTLEVARFCSRVGTTNRGSLSKLTKIAFDYARSNGLEGLISYVDTRFGTGVGYEKSGWRLMSATGARFWWTDNVSRYDRFSCRADKTTGMSEADVAATRGLKKIWGCENLLFTFNDLHEHFSA